MASSASDAGEVPTPHGDGGRRGSLSVRTPRDDGLRLGIHIERLLQNQIARLQEYVPQEAARLEVRRTERNKAIMQHAVFGAWCEACGDYFAYRRVRDGTM